jgi:hypothetical protein
MEDPLFHFLWLEGRLPLEDFSSLEIALRQSAEKFGLRLTFIGLPPSIYAGVRRRQLNHMRYLTTLEVNRELEERSERYFPRALPGERNAPFVPIDLTSPETLAKLRFGDDSREADFELALHLIGMNHELEAIRDKALKKYPAPALLKAHDSPNATDAMEGFESFFGVICELRKLRQATFRNRLRKIFEMINDPKLPA